VVVPQAPGNGVGQPQRCPIELLSLDDIGREGVLVTDGLRRVPGHHRGGVDAPRPRREVEPMPTESASEGGLGHGGQLTDDRHPVVGQRLLHLGSDAPQPTDGKRREERGLLAGGDDDHAIGLFEVRGDLRHELVRGRAHADHQAHLAPTRSPSRRRWSAISAGRTGDVEEMPRQADRLDQRREGLELP
jgi:hypothetical protein